MASAQTTTDHDVIRSWAEERGGQPAIVSASADDGRGGGILRFDFGEPDENLEIIEWDEFFEIFEESGLALLYQEKTADGSLSRFNKFVNRPE